MLWLQGESHASLPNLEASLAPEPSSITVSEDTVDNSIFDLLQRAQPALQLPHRPAAAAEPPSRPATGTPAARDADRHAGVSGGRAHHDDGPPQQGALEVAARDAGMAAAAAAAAAVAALATPPPAHEASAALQVLSWVCAPP